nr:MAG TPA: hypothetical protein [Caudoviricetes sp.]
MRSIPEKRVLALFGFNIHTKDVGCFEQDYMLVIRIVQRVEHPGAFADGGNLIVALCQALGVADAFGGCVNALVDVNAILKADGRDSAVVAVPLVRVVAEGGKLVLILRHCRVKNDVLDVFAALGVVVHVEGVNALGFADAYCDGSASADGVGDGGVVGGDGVSLSHDVFSFVPLRRSFLFLGSCSCSLPLTPILYHTVFSMSIGFSKVFEKMLHKTMWLKLCSLC